MRDEQGPVDAIVVLGAAQYDGRPSPVLRARLNHAFKLWRDGRGEWLVVTGGVGSGDTTSEAKVGQRFLAQLGVPPKSVLLEATGRTTEESMRGVASILGEKQLKRVLLVSDPFHMLRLDISARSHGLIPLTSPTRTSPISQNRFQLATYVMAESFKVPWTLIEAGAGWLNNRATR
jgi:uncharacterized SAM-binding protein YcdF (DUF218 family)